MPALPAVPQVCRFQMLWHKASDLDVLCRLFFKYASTAPTVSDLNTWAAASATSYSTHLVAAIGTDTTLNAITITDLSSSTAAEVVHSDVVAGTDAGGPLPGGTAVLLNFSVARRYRGGKPRIYLPAGTATALPNAQAWDPTFVTNLTSQWSTFVAGVTGGAPAGMGAIKQVNVSYYHGFTVQTNPSTGRARNVPTLRGGGPLVDDIIATNVNIKPASQRRRNLH